MICVQLKKFKNEVMMTCPGVRIVELFLEVLNLNFPRHCKSQLKIFKEVLFITFYYLFITFICFLTIFIY